MSYDDEVYDELEKTLGPLLDTIQSIESPLHAETSALYSILTIARQFNITTSLGLLERAKHLALKSPIPEEEQCPKFPFIS